MAKSFKLRTTTPAVVWLSIAPGLAAILWIDFFEPENAHVTVESSQSWSAVVIGAAAIAGTVLGVRLLWGFYVLARR